MVDIFIPSLQNRRNKLVAIRVFIDMTTVYSRSVPIWNVVLIITLALSNTRAGVSAKIFGTETKLDV